jgi:hypothetical protein
MIVTDTNAVIINSKMITTSNFVEFERSAVKTDEDKP